MAREKEEVLVSSGWFEDRVVHTSQKHPQVGYIHFEGERQKVYMGFWGGHPVWTLAFSPDDPCYLYCKQKPMPIEDDPDYQGL